MKVADVFTAVLSIKGGESFCLGDEEIFELYESLQNIQM